MSRNSFFSVVDRLVEKSRKQFAETRATLKSHGWVLRPVSDGGMWRARRWTKAAGTQRLYAPTPALLIEQTKADWGRRQPKEKEVADVAAVG